MPPKQKWLTLYEDKVITPSGTHGMYTYVKGAPFALIVVYDGTYRVMVRQFRYPLQQVVTEFPGCSIDDSEEPIEAAQRELREETGYIAAEWTRLGTILNPNKATMFLAQGLAATGDNSMKEDGIAECIRVTRAEFDNMITSDQVPDSKNSCRLSAI